MHLIFLSVIVLVSSPFCSSVSVHLAKWTEIAEMSMVRTPNSLLSTEQERLRAASKKDLHFEDTIHGQHVPLCGPCAGSCWNYQGARNAHRRQKRKRSMNSGFSGFFAPDIKETLQHIRHP